MAPAHPLDAQGSKLVSSPRTPRLVAHGGLWALLAAAVPTPAAAHEGTGLAGGFVAGFLHPISGLDHLRAMVAVGVWGAFLGRPLMFALPMIFPGVMVLGAALAMAGVTNLPIEAGIALSVLILGLMILLAVRTTIALACLIVGLFGLFHGLAHGLELPSAADPVGYSVGFVLSTGLLHLAGIALGLLNRTRPGTLALRGAGGLIAICGLVFLSGALAG